MIHKLFLFIIICLFLSVNSLVVYKKDLVVNKNSLFFVNPIILKFFSGEYSTLLADKLWLMSNQIDEISIVYSKDKEKAIKQMEKGFDTISILDPNFSSPIVYSATYFMTVNKTKENFELGMNLINKALEKAPNNKQLLYIKFVFLTTFPEYKPDINVVIDLAQRLYKIGMINSGPLKVDDFIAETVEFLSEEKSKKDNLLRLYKYAKNEDTKKDIEEILKKYEENGEK